MSDAGSNASLLGVHWASRVNPIVIRRLYQTDARGKTFQHKHLVGGGAIAFHTEYIDRFKHARSPQEKMLAIDRLIHAYHWELVQSPGRSAARELIYANNYNDLLTFLDTLSYGDRSTSGLEAAKREWDRKLASWEWHRSIGFGHQARATSPDDS